jgi:hypothetical protein
MSLNMMYVEE